MIEHLLHLVGLCPDHLVHFDLMDFVAYNWTSLVDTINYYYRKIKLVF